MNSAADPYMFELARLNQMADLPFGNANAHGELFRRL
jgi:hypothetical protein